MDTSGSVRYLVVTFDRKTAGQRSRDKNPQLAAKHPGGTKIELREEAYSLSKTGHGATAYLVKFPVTLAFATTAHKTQGMTFHKPKTSNLDIASTFESCQGYVMLGRNQALEQVFISKPWGTEPPETWLTSHIYTSDQALEEYEKMNLRAINNNTEGWYATQTNTIKIASLNVARLAPHFSDILADPTLHKAELIHLSETWVKPEEDLNRFQLPGYTARFLSVGEGKGIVTYSTDLFKLKDEVLKAKHQIVRYQTLNLDSIHVYRSSNSNIQKLEDDLIALIDEGKTTHISGDFNICLKKTPYNSLTKQLKHQDFDQLIQHPTHIEGGLIDHIYFRNNAKIFKAPNIERYSPYYSNHDCLCTTLQPYQL